MGVLLDLIRPVCPHCDREVEKIERQDLWRRIQALEKVAHEPVDFSDIYHRLDNLDGGKVSPRRSLP